MAAGFTFTFAIHVLRQFFSGYTAMSLARFDHEDNTNDPYHSVIRYLESVGGKYSDENE
jgi:hypothetical protein